jgi:hypothetical protein
MANDRVARMRDMLALAACLRRAACEIRDPRYMGKLIRAALDLETRASFLANARPDEAVGEARQAALYGPVDKSI